MRERLEIPNRTRVWIGHIDGSHIGAYSTDLGKLSSDGIPTGNGMAFTLIVGQSLEGQALCEGMLFRKSSEKSWFYR